MNNALLRTALTANAIFSFASGCAMAVFGDELATLILARSSGWHGAWFLRAFGVGLMGFAVLLARMALDGGVNLKRVAPIVVSDLAWVLLSAALVVLAPGVLTGPGRLVVAVIAAVVGLMGVLQWCGGRLSPGPSTTA